MVGDCASRQCGSSNSALFCGCLEMLTVNESHSGIQSVTGILVFSLLSETFLINLDGDPMKSVQLFFLNMTFPMKSLAWLMTMMSTALAQQPLPNVLPCPISCSAPPTLQLQDAPNPSWLLSLMQAAANISFLPPHAGRDLTKIC